MKEHENMRIWQKRTPVSVSRMRLGCSKRQVFVLGGSWWLCAATLGEVPEEDELAGSSASCTSTVLSSSKKEIMEDNR